MDVPTTGRPVRADETDRDRKKRQKDARAALLDLLDRLKIVCGQLSRLEDWYDKVQRVESILEKYSDVIPLSTQERLKAATHITDSTETGLKKACSLLKDETLSAIRALPAAGLLAPALAAGLVIVIIIVAVGVAYLNLTAVDLAIANQGCGPISLGTSLGFPDWLGVSMPESIPDHGTATARLPRLTFTVDATQSGTIGLSLPGYTTSIPIGSNLTGIAFNEQSILGSTLSVNLGDQPTNQLTLTCSQ